MYRWGRLWCLGFLVLLLPIRPFAAERSVTLAWDANTEPDIGGYILRVAIDGLYPGRIDVGTVTTKKLENIIPGLKYTFTVTAYNTAGLESDPSNEVLFTLSADPGELPRLAGAATITLMQGYFHLEVTREPDWPYTIERTTDLGSGTWVPVGLVTASETGAISFTDPSPMNRSATRFYRVVPLWP